MAYQYTTPELVQAELRASIAFASTTVPSLTQVTTWIAEESARVNGMTGASFTETLHDEYHDYNGEDFIYLRTSPMLTVGTASIATVLYATLPVNDADYANSWETKVENTDYIVYADRAKILPLYTEWEPKIGEKRFRIIYNSGYSEVPLDVQMYVTKAVALRSLNTLIQSNVNNGSDGGSISVGSISIVEPSGIGLNSYKQLTLDINDLKKELFNGGSVYRYDFY